MWKAKLVRRVAFAIVGILFAGPSLCGQETSTIDKTLENIAGEFAQCAAYYRLVYYALIASHDEATAKAYREIEDTAMVYSLVLANEGRDQTMAVQVTNSRIEMNMKTMKNEINNRNENISILINKHHERCEKIIKTPPPQVIDLLLKRSEEAKRSAGQQSR